MDAQRRLTLVAAASEDSGEEPLVRELYGRVLRDARLDQDRSLEDVACAVGMSKQYLSEIERGKKEPSSEMLRAVCGALGMSVEHLLFRSGRRLGAAHRTSVTGTVNRQVPTLLAA
ncbi:MULTISPECIES: helix-turn-helix domain-containing protein [unclassified Rhodococcus (in: high G+C Gram-positive bacteria)]|uniref:helix-turn-helix domain-containing protein n=1 Tax=unclassified Rhodococcus (in: high G+C Gram-positive bacteria) TaxID=192944 RepID=UPI001639FD5B|nr:MULTISPECIES: helix-turn-helix transcriptional regulator [unclassified Rhodococcus (in: high G+C Gram-positive bacteria)]MBC2638961.1 helix-turn-helix transcriptional regulator [Rhodococcus sp. 3A]MBC2896298.1 helix-turn-helix transcriptional regulator [Rhodococcus sp. 4CII]